MIDYREGVKSPGPCAFCNKVVPSTLTNVTISICEGLEEVENVLVDVCDECDNMISIPARSEPPLQQAYKELVETGAVSCNDGITIELKSIVDARKDSNKKTEQDFPQEYPLVAAAG